ncbi:hypothetical protein WJX73_001969 [Symbiochloris irregularis]|uniref:Uncharacterized protein n=1 Tax=Symbiochloris irregularis TaxID=706552 RepID=A0AAW1PMF8_9CHLO
MSGFAAFQSGQNAWRAAASQSPAGAFSAQRLDETNTSGLSFDAQRAERDPPPPIYPLDERTASAHAKEPWQYAPRIIIGCQRVANP